MKHFLGIILDSERVSDEEFTKISDDIKAIVGNDAKYMCFKLQGSPDNYRDDVREYLFSDEFYQQYYV